MCAHHPSPPQLLCRFALLLADVLALPRCTPCPVLASSACHHPDPFPCCPALSALQTTPILAAAPVYVHLKSHLPELDQVVHWGRFGDPASWGPQPAAAPVPIPVEEQQ